jgi:MFS superfamily sulfate permease-like transporter
VEGRVFFANAERILQRMKPLVDAAKPKVVLIDLSAVFDLEYTALKMLTEAEKKRREEGILLWLAGLNPEVLAVVQRSPLGETLGRERMHFNLEQAVAKYLARNGAPRSLTLTAELKVARQCDVATFTSASKLVVWSF